MKVLFLVNGAPQSAAAVRARSFVQWLPRDWITNVCYRPQRKWQGVLPFLRAALRQRPDVIYVMDTAYTGVLAGYAAKRFTGCKMVTDTGDVAHELAKSSGGYSRHQLALIGAVERLALRRSDALVVRGSQHKTLLEGQGVRDVTFIPDGVDVEAVGPSDAAALRARLGLSDQFVVGVVGTMTWSEKYRMCYGWDVVEALGLLPGRSVKALLVGDGDGRARLERRAQDLGVSDRVVFTGGLPYEALPEYVSAMDACVSTQSNDIVGQVRTTGKLPLYLAYGRYVLATDVGEAARVLPGVGCLLPYAGVRDDAHPARLAAHLEALAAAPSRHAVCPEARRVAAENFDYRMLTKRVQALCGRLATRRKNGPP